MKTVTVVEGDTLWEIAKAHLGDPVRWNEIFQINQPMILEDHRRRGLQEILGRVYIEYMPQNWIFPGMVLQLPEGV